MYDDLALERKHFKEAPVLTMVVTEVEHQITDSMVYVWLEGHGERRWIDPGTPGLSEDIDSVVGDVLTLRWDTGVQIQARCHRASDLSPLPGPDTMEPGERADCCSAPIRWRVERVNHGKVNFCDRHFAAQRRSLLASKVARDNLELKRENEALKRRLKPASTTTN